MRLAGFLGWWFVERALTRQKWFCAPSSMGSGSVFFWSVRVRRARGLCGQCQKWKNGEGLITEPHILSLKTKFALTFRLENKHFLCVSGCCSVLNSSSFVKTWYSVKDKKTKSKASSLRLDEWILFRVLCVCILNSWGASNRWFESQVFTLETKYSSFSWYISSLPKFLIVSCFMHGPCIFLPLLFFPQLYFLFVSGRGTKQQQPLGGSLLPYDITVNSALMCRCLFHFDVRVLVCLCGSCFS